MPESGNISNTGTIITLITGILSSGLINIIITNLLYKHNLKKEQKIGQENMLGEKINNALMQMRDLELQCKVIEIYDAENEVLSDKFDAFQVSTVYLGILTDDDSFDKFTKCISRLRREQERYLGYKESALLLFIDRYCFNLKKFAHKYQLPYQVLGATFLFDFEEWQKCCEKILIKRINKPKYKLYDKNSNKWIREQKKMKKKLWEKTLLYKVTCGRECEELEIVKATILEPDLDKANELLEKQIEFRKKHKIRSWIRKYKHRIWY